MKIKVGYIDPVDSDFVKVKKFGTKYYVDDEVQNQGTIAVNYSAVIPFEIAVGVPTVLRIYYNKVDDSFDTQAIFNLMLHEVIDEVV